MYIYIYMGPYRSFLGTPLNPRHTPFTSPKPLNPIHYFLNFTLKSYTLYSFIAYLFYAICAIV